MNKKIALINEKKLYSRMAYMNSIPIISAFGDRAYIELSSAIKYDAFISGYIKNCDKILELREFIGNNKIDNPLTLTYIDPSFADNGVKYDGITDKHIDNYKKLLELSDIMSPNLTEACFLTNQSFEDYKNKYCTINFENDNKEKTDELSKKIIGSILPLLDNLRLKKNQISIITGIELYNAVLTVLDVFDGDHGKRQTTCNYSKKIYRNCSTKEVFNSFFFETSINGFNLIDSLSIATSFINNSLRYSNDKKIDITEGIFFEPILYDNIVSIKNKFKENINKNVKE